MRGEILNLDGDVSVVGIALDHITVSYLFFETDDTGSRLPVVVGTRLVDGDITIVDAAFHITPGIEGTDNTADTADLHTA